MKKIKFILLLQNIGKTVKACLPVASVLELIVLLLCYQAATAQYIIHIAGNNSCSDMGDGGSALHASINAPVSICRDNAGNLYIGDVGEGGGGKWSER